MKVTGLPVRVFYAAIALPLGAMLGFVPSMQLLPRLVAKHPQLDPQMDGSGLFKLALWIAAETGLTAFLLALILPWIRHRSRSGRPLRIVLSALTVVVASAAFAGLGHPIAYDLVFAIWLSLLLSYTFVRYGVLDHTRRSKYY